MESKEITQGKSLDTLDEPSFDGGEYPHPSRELILHEKNFEKKNQAMICVGLGRDRQIGKPSFTGSPSGKP